MAHKHDFEGLPWPFADSEDTASFCCHHVFDGRPILYVTHDIEDGAWQFLCGEGGHEAIGPRIVCLGCVMARDKTLFALVDLPRGWCAERESVDSDWNRLENLPGPEDEHD